MVQFGRLLAEQLVPEWSTAYIDYNALKQKLDSVVEALDEVDALAESGVESGRLAKPGSPCAVQRGAVAAAAVATASRAVSGLFSVTWTEAAKGGSPGPCTTVSERSSLGATRALGEERAFFEALDESVRVAATFVAEQKAAFKERLAEVLAALLRHQQFCAAARRREEEGGAAAAEAAAGVTMGDVLDERSSPPSEAFIVPPRHGVLEMQSLSHAAAVPSPPPPIAEDGGSPFTAHLHLPHLPLHLPHLPHLPHLSDATIAQRDAKMLRRAMIELYRGVGLLSGFLKLNLTALTKILKKHDKLTGWAASEAYLSCVEHSPLSATEASLHRMTLALEREFESLDVLVAEERWSAVSHHTQEAAAAHRQRRHAALAKLRPPPPRLPGATTLLAAGFAAGGCVAAAANVIALLVQALSIPEAVPHVQALFPVLRGPLLFMLHVAGYGLAVAAFQHVRISFAFIFGSVPGTEMAFPEYLLIAGLLAGCWLVAWAGILSNLITSLQADPSGGLADSTADTGLLPILLLSAAVALIAVPLPASIPQWPPHTSRSFFLGVFGRMLAAPFFAVRLPHFFLADQLVSQSQGLSDLMYTGCYYLSGAYRLHPSSAAGACLNGRGGLTPAVKLGVCLIPLWIRILQCLRRLRDERARLHVVNVGKYSSSAAALTVRYLHDAAGSTPGWTAASALAYLFAASYSYGWDLKMDWGFTLSRRARHPLLRDALMVDSPWLYYAACGLNALLRLTWIFSLLSLSSLSASARDMGLSTTLAAIEIGRRSAWNYFRVENEQVQNMAHFRAVMAVPLPKLRGGLKPGLSVRRRRSASFDSLQEVKRRSTSFDSLAEAEETAEHVAMLPVPQAGAPPEETPPKADRSQGTDGAEAEAADSPTHWEMTQKSLSRVGSRRELDSLAEGALPAPAVSAAVPFGEHFNWEASDD